MIEKENIRNRVDMVHPRDFMMKEISWIAGVGDRQVAPYDKTLNQEDKKTGI